MTDLSAAISKYGAQAHARLANTAVRGDPEFQLRAPLNGLVDDLAIACGVRGITPVADTRVSGPARVATPKTSPNGA